MDPIAESLVRRVQVTLCAALCLLYIMAVPASAQVTFERYYGGVNMDVSLPIYDSTGRLVETLVNETQQPGIHHVRWFPEGMPVAVYFCRLQPGELARTREMLLVR